METVKSFNFQVAQPGVKPSSQIEAGITLTPTLNKFMINGLASKAIGLVSGTGKKDEEKTAENSITMVVNEDSKDIDNKFYVCQGIESNSAKLAAHENEQGNGKDLAFTFSGIYSRIMLAAVIGDLDTLGVPKERLRMLGLAKKGTSLKKVYAKIDVDSPISTTVEGETKLLYRLYDFMVTDHTPKVFGKE